MFTAPQMLPAPYTCLANVSGVRTVFWAASWIWVKRKKELANLRHFELTRKQHDFVIKYDSPTAFDLTNEDCVM